MTGMMVADASPEHEHIVQCCTGIEALLCLGHHIEAKCSTSYEMRLSHFRLGNLDVFEASGSPHARHALRVSGSNESVAVLLNVAGNGVLRQGVREARLQPASLHLLDDSQPFTVQSQEDFRHLVLRVPPAFMESVVRDWRPLTVSCMASCCGAAAVFAGTLRNIFTQRETLAPRDFKSCADAVLDLLGGTLRSFARKPQDENSAVETYHLERVKAYAHGRLTDPDLDMKQIASAVGLSTSYIHRLFSSCAMTLMQWITAERLDACHRDLSSPARLKRPVFLIAQDWGFSNHAHFSRSFRARFGVSPRDVRGGMAPCRSGAAQCTQDVGTDCSNIGSLSDKARLHKGNRLVSDR